MAKTRKLVLDFKPEFREQYKGFPRTTTGTIQGAFIVVDKEKNTSVYVPMYRLQRLMVDGSLHKLPKTTSTDEGKSASKKQIIYEEI